MADYWRSHSSGVSSGVRPEGRSLKRLVTRASLIAIAAAMAIAACGRSGLTPLGGATANLAVTIGGLGWVTSAPAGISCPLACSADFPKGSTVTLVASTNVDGVSLGSWTGCQEQPDGSCRIKMKQPAAVDALFDN